MWYGTRLFASLRPAGDSLSLWEGLSPSFNGFHPIKSGPLRVVSLKKYINIYIFFIYDLFAWPPHILFVPCEI